MLKLKEIREEKSVLQKVLADKINKTRACVSSWEVGKTEPDLDSLIRLADALEVSTDELLGRGAASDAEIVTALTRDEKELLDLYDKMSTPNKYQLLGFAKGLLK